MIKDAIKYKQIQGANALKEILNLGVKNLKNKNYKPLDDTFRDVKKRIEELKRDGTIKCFEDD